MAATITVDEWLGELNALVSASASDGFTVVEAVAATGRSNDWVRQKIKAGIAAGLVVFAGPKPTVGIDGRPCRVPSYKMVKRGKK